MLESKIERYLCEQVEKLGGEVRKVKWIGRRGAPDRLVMHHLVANLWVELKAPGVKPKPHQIREHVRMRHVGLHVIVIDSFDQVDQLIAQIRNGNFRSVYVDII